MEYCRPTLTFVTKQNQNESIIDNHIDAQLYLGRADATTAGDTMRQKQTSVERMTSRQTAVRANVGVSAVTTTAATHRSTSFSNPGYNIVVGKRT